MNSTSAVETSNHAVSPASTAISTAGRVQLLSPFGAGLLLLRFGDATSLSLGRPLLRRTRVNADSYHLSTLSSGNCFSLVSCILLYVHIRVRCLRFASSGRVLQLTLENDCTHSTSKLASARLAWSTSRRHPCTSHDSRVPIE